MYDKGGILSRNYMAHLSAQLSKTFQNDKTLFNLSVQNEFYC